MILASLGELARRERLLEDPDYEPRAVAWIISIAENGYFLGAIPTAGEDKRGKMFEIPRRNGRTSAARADFAVDKSEYVFGVEPDGKRSKEHLSKRRSLFRQELERAANDTKSPALAAVLAFLSWDEQRQRAIDVVAERGYASNDLFAFEYEGELAHARPEVKEYFSSLRRMSRTGDAQCLVCGHTGDISQKHPSVQLPGGTTSGVALVSFNSDAFESYGFSRNENAPVCPDCADAYTTALKRLLGERYPNPRAPGEALPKRFVRLSADTTAVFWADREATVLEWIAGDFRDPNAVKALLESSHKGQRPASLKTPFYCLLLTGAQGRAVVRGAYLGTLEELENNVREYFEQIDVGAEMPQGLSWLLRSLVLQGKLENLPPALGGDVFVAILSGRQFPRMLLSRAVERCRAEGTVTRDRAALLRAFVIRNEKKEVSVALDRNNSEPGYRLGRLFAVLENIDNPEGKRNRTLADRYYGAASTRPGTVFPRLMSMAQHHSGQLTPGLARYFDQEIGQVVDGLGVFPSTLSLDQQGLFAIGYYHQKYSGKRAVAASAGEGEIQEKMKGEAE